MKRGTNNLVGGGGSVSYTNARKNGSGLHACEKELLELHSSAFRHKNIPGYNTMHLNEILCLQLRYSWDTAMRNDSLLLLICFYDAI
jgi:hypothetical protein